MSSRPTDSALRRSRSADSSAVSQPLLDVHLGPQAGQAVEAVPGQPRNQLALGLHLFLQRAQRLQAGGEVGLARWSRLSTSCCVRRCSSSSGTASLTSARRASISSLASSACGAANLQVFQLLQVGRGELLAFGGQALAPAAQRARLLLDAAALGGQHLDLLLHLRDLAALAAGMRVCAMRTASSKSGSRIAFFFGLRGQQSRPARRRRRSLQRCLLQLELGVRPGASTHCAFCACSSARRCSARWRPSTT